MTRNETERMLDALGIQVTAACVAISQLAELIGRIDSDLHVEAMAAVVELRREMSSALLVAGGTTQ